MSKPFIGRSWVFPLYFYTKGARRAATVVQWYRTGKVNDWQLWEILSLYGHPFARAGDAAAVYGVLGFVPHVGYPLTRIRKEKYDASERIEGSTEESEAIRVQGGNA